MTCCAEAALGASLSFEHEGESVDVYGECLACGATVKDVFTFSHTTVVEGGDRR